MGRNATNPTLFDEVLQLSISKLKEWGYLHPDHRTQAVINWGKAASVSIKASTKPPSPYIELSYTYQGKALKYQIQLMPMPSNLGKGFYYYFICPITGKRCRKLYLINGQFAHRTAFAGMYNCQIKSKTGREFSKTFGAIINIDEIYNEINSKYFTRYYKGKPTRRYKRMLKQLEKTKQTNIDKFKNLLHYYKVQP
jgi:hypothetical protein